MSGVINRAGSRSGVVGHMSDVVLLRKDQLPSSGAYEVKDTFRKEFKTYEFVFHEMKFVTDNIQLRFNFSADNGSSWVTGSNYSARSLQVIGGSTSIPINLTNAAYATVGGYGNQGGVGNEGSSGSVWIYDPMNPAARKQGRNEWMIWHYSGVVSWAAGAFAYQSSDPFNACKFYPSSGNFDSSTTTYGAVSVYGYR